MLPNGQGESRGNWLIGNRLRKIASRSAGWSVIRDYLLWRPGVMVGCQGAIRNSIMQTKIYNAVFEPSKSAALFRVVEERLPHTPFLRDLTYVDKQGYLKLLRSLFN